MRLLFSIPPGRNLPPENFPPPIFFCLFSQSIFSRQFPLAKIKKYGKMRMIRYMICKG